MVEKNAGLDYEFGVVQSRNDTIREVLEQGKIPMLSFEQRQLEIELLGHEITQAELGVLLGEAMTTTSETWHDNAQADAVVMQSHIHGNQAKEVIEALRESIVIPDEQDEKDKVSIGALVRVLIDQLPETIFITGKQRRLPGEVAAIVGEETSAVNIRSPIGAAIFDQVEGATVSYRVGDRNLQVTIVSIEYPNTTSLKA